MENKQMEKNTSGGRHAVVIGASMAGLLAGRVLADHFERVTIVERDRITADAEPRKGVPQGRHSHVLLYKGVSILTELFPDLFPALAQHGSTVIDTSADVRWHHFGGWKSRFPSPIAVYCQSRPLLEQQVRARLAARPNVCFLDDCEVTGLCATDDHGRITGVQLMHGSPEQRAEELSADLVVDAGGRGSQAPRWLRSLGYDQVEETLVRVDVGYASRLYRRPGRHPLNQNVLVINPTPPGEKRGGYLIPIEGDRWQVSLAGWLRDYPPDDAAGFLAYARSLPAPDLYEAIKDAEPVTPIAIHRFPANQRRHYERLARFPEGFLVLGDAACSFNPIYGQGMTTAALAAQALNNCLHRHKRLGTRRDDPGFARRCQRAIARAVAVPWQLATSEDYRYPDAQGKRPAGTRLLNWYTGRVHELAKSRPYVTRRFYEVLHMLKPPAALFDPRILFAVMFAGRPARPCRSDLKGADSAMMMSRRA
jgi:2-polyprenyl-6-methoxyphenol hydroxylase-like FAD-dependent oxidoreductase